MSIFYMLILCIVVCVLLSIFPWAKISQLLHDEQKYEKYQNIILKIEARLSDIQKFPHGSREEIIEKLNECLDVSLSIKGYFVKQDLYKEKIGEKLEENIILAQQLKIFYLKNPIPKDGVDTSEKDSYIRLNTYPEEAYVETKQIMESFAPRVLGSSPGSVEVFHATPRYDRIELRNISNALRLNHLIHFTPLENLQSILEYGIIRRSELLESNLNFDYNDKYRFDNRINSISLSISFPNYKMFYCKRQENRSKEWVVLELSPSIIWNKECAFFPGNAASSQFNNVDLSLMKSVQAFKCLFFENENNVRYKNKLPSNFPTNPQSEILCFDNIEPIYIQKIHMQKPMKSLFQNNTRLFEVNSYFFNARKDYKDWS